MKYYRHLKNLTNLISLFANSFKQLRNRSQQIQPTPSLLVNKQLLNLFALIRFSGVGLMKKLLRTRQNMRCSTQNIFGRW